jgi:hypothetical protein
MKKLFVLATALLMLNVSAQEGPDILDKISSVLPAWLDAFPLEKVYVQTDKDVYAPGEIIWFSALVTSRTATNYDNLSPELNLNLYDASGKFITGDKFQVNDVRVNGDIRLPAVLKKGRYYLVAFTPLQLNPDEAFVKPFIVDQPYEGEASVFLSNPEELYVAGREARIGLLVNDHNGQPVDRYSFDFTVNHAGKTLAEGRLRSVQGTASIRLTMPENPGIEPVTLTLSHPRNLWMEKYNLMTNADQLSVVFYPEGGSLIDNVPVKMGYYVTAHGSVPVSVEADILDESGQMVAKTGTFMPGYGLYPFRSEPGKMFRMVITSNYGKGQSFELPVENPGKVSLAVTRQQNGYIYADVISPGEELRTLSIAVTERFNMVWAASFEAGKSARIRIPEEELSHGLQQISVFSQNGDLLASRLIFTPERSQLKLKVTPEIDNNQVRITVQAEDADGKPVETSLSLAVVDKSRVSDSFIHMKDYFLLNSELKNPILETSVLYDEEVNKEMTLDYMLISNELKGFSWENVLAFGEDPGLVTLPASRGVRGRVTTRRGEPAGGAKVSILNSRDMQMYSTTADQNGNFIFPSLNPLDFSDYAFTAADESGRGSFNVELEPSFSDKIGMEIIGLDRIFASAMRYESPSPDYYRSNPDFVLKAPAVIKPAPQTATKTRSESYKALLQTSTSLPDVIKMMKPYTLMNGQIVFMGTQNSFYAQSGALIVIDGQKMGTSADALNMVSPHDVESINISLDPSDIQKYTGFNNVGIIEINTKKGGTVKAPGMSLPATEETYSDGYRIPRSFLSTAGIKYQSGKDMRTTLYWNPQLEPGTKGSTTFAIPLSQVKSAFVINVEGMDNQGNTGKTSVVFQSK